jgi:hypothetical protein
MAGPGPGGGSSAFNITAAKAIKTGSGTLYSAIVVAPGTTSGAFTFNDASGLITAQNITAITAATNAVVTLSTGGASNPFAVGNTITFASVGGMTQINAVVGTVTAIGGVTTAWTVTTSINSSAFTAYTSGGTAASFGIGNQIWSLAYNATANVAGAAINLLAWPCAYGIVLSAVPGGSPALNVAYS